MKRVVRSVVRRGSRSGQRGQLLPLVAVLMAMMGLFAIALGRIGAGVIGRARAQAAADAAALAGTRRGRPGAEALAAGNGAVLVSYVEVGGDIRVGVRMPGGASAIAQARLTRPDAAVDDRLAPAMRAVVARSAQVLGRDVPIAQVGAEGLTIEVPAAVAGLLSPVAADTGLCAEPTLGAGWFSICGPVDPSSG